MAKLSTGLLLRLWGGHGERATSGPLKVLSNKVAKAFCSLSELETSQDEKADVAGIGCSAGSENPVVEEPPVGLLLWKGPAGEFAGLKPVKPVGGILQPDAHLNPSEVMSICRALRRRGIEQPRELLVDYPTNYRLLHSLNRLKDLGMNVAEQKKVILRSLFYVESSPEALDGKLDILRKTFALDAEGMKSILLKDPLVVEYAFDANVLPFLGKLQKAEVSPAEVKIMVENYPEVLGVRMPLLTRLIDVFSIMGFSETALMKMIHQSPAILKLPVNKKVKPFFQRLLDIGLSKGEIIKVLTSAPNLLSCDFAVSVEPKLAWFGKELGLDREQILHGVFAEVPKLFLENRITRFQKVVNILQSWGLELHECRSILLKRPNLLGNAFGNKIARLHQRFEFLQMTLNKSSKDVVKLPAYLTWSFENNILFRVALLDSYGVDYSSMPLEELFNASNEALPDGCDPEAYNRFRNWWRTLKIHGKLQAIKNRAYPPAEILEDST